MSNTGKLPLEIYEEPYIYESRPYINGEYHVKAEFDKAAKQYNFFKPGNEKEKMMSDSLEKALGEEEYAKLFFGPKNYRTYCASKSIKGTIAKPISSKKLYQMFKYVPMYKKMDKGGMEKILQNPDTPKALKRYIAFNLEQDLLTINYKEWIYNDLFGDLDEK